MLGLIFWVAAGAIVLFLAPPLVPGQYRNWFVQNTLRAAGLFIIGFGLLSTSYVQVPDGHVGHLFRIYGGGSLGAGRIVAANGENGPQAEIFTPGFHPRLLVNVIYEVDTQYEEVSIKEGKVGVLVAKDGAPLRPGQAFADPFPVALGYQMLDAETFLKNGDQRGMQLTVLTPGM